MVALTLGLAIGVALCIVGAYLVYRKMAKGLLVLLSGLAIVASGVMDVPLLIFMVPTLIYLADEKTSTQRPSQKSE